MPLFTEMWLCCYSDLIVSLTNSYLFLLLNWVYTEIGVYSYFKKDCRKKCAHDNPDRYLLFLLLSFSTRKQISLKDSSELKTTHSTFRDCRD